MHVPWSSSFGMPWHLAWAGRSLHKIVGIYALPVVYALVRRRSTGAAM